MSSIIRTLIIVIMLFGLTGCYNPKELDDLAYVIAIGVDKGKEQDLSVTFQIAIPLNISGEGSSPGKETSTLLTVDADSVYGAVSKINSEISKEVNLSQNKLVVFSEELAKEGLEGYINPFVSNREIRPTSSVVVSKSSAKDFLSTIAPKLETNPARYLDLMLSSHYYSGYSVSSELLNFYWDVQSEYEEPIAILAEINTDSEEENQKSKVSNSSVSSSGNSENSEGNIKENSTPIFSGLAAFAGTTMVGEFTEEEVIPHLILTSGLQPINFEVPDINNQEMITTVTLSQPIKPKIEIDVINNIPKINIEANIRAKLVTSGTATDYFNDNNRYKLAKTVENKLTKIVYAYLDKCSKELNVDIVGFGKLLKPKFLTLSELEEIKWQDIFKNSEFTVKIKIDLNTSQIVTYTEPIKTSEKIEEKQKTSEDGATR